MGCVFILLEEEQFSRRSCGLSSLSSKTIQLSLNSINNKYFYVLIQMCVTTQPAALFFFSSTTSYCVRIILSLTTQGVPDTTTFTEGDGCMRVCVCVWVCLCLGECLLTRMNMLLHLMCIDSPVTSHSSSFCLCVCLFVSDTFTIVIFIPCRPQQGSTLLPFPATQTTLHVLSVNTHSAENWSM